MSIYQCLPYQQGAPSLGLRDLETYLEMSQARCVTTVTASGEISFDNRIKIKMSLLAD